MNAHKEIISNDMKAMIRVNQAGEFGATRIYAGQLAVLGKSAAAPSLREMLSQEEEHLKVFNTLSVENGVQPTILQPLWHLGGYVMGAATALLGEKAAHACTIAVEEVIADHYQDQLNRLEQNPESKKSIHLHRVITQFRADEIAHKEHAEAEGGREAPAYELLTQTVKSISKVAIWLSTRI